ncbi:MAG: DUF302 domain-containing protein [Bacteroidales bacterium]|nr:DUF302 domain-containing protein [Bacteroidales bacterium]
MKYYFSKTIKGKFNETVKKITRLLIEESFGIITKIDVTEIMRKKLDVDYKNYVIMSACNPRLAIRALQTEDKIGALLPCNLIVIDQGEGNIEVAYMDAENLLDHIGNPELEILAREVNNTFSRVLEKL